VTNFEYEVLSPAGLETFDEIKFSGGFENLEGRTVGFLWDYVFRGDEIFEIIQQDFRERFPGVNFVDFSVFGDVHGPEERKVIAELPDKLRANKVDAVIVGVGA